MSKDQQKVYEALKGARDLLAQGWVQGIAWATDVDGTECYCATGAIREACTTRPDPFPYILEAIERVLVAAGRCPVPPRDCDWISAPGELQSWNDDLYRTQEEVLKAFDEAIENLKQELSDGV